MKVSEFNIVVQEFVESAKTLTDGHGMGLLFNLAITWGIAEGKRMESLAAEQSFKKLKERFNK